MFRMSTILACAISGVCAEVASVMLITWYPWHTASKMVARMQFGYCVPQTTQMSRPDSSQHEIQFRIHEAAVPILHNPVFPVNGSQWLHNLTPFRPGHKVSTLPEETIEAVHFNVAPVGTIFTHDMKHRQLVHAEETPATFL